LFYIGNFLDITLEYFCACLYHFYYHLQTVYFDYLGADRAMKKVESRKVTEKGISNY